MDDAALQKRLRTIERRQSVVIAMLAGLYLFGALLFLEQQIAEVTPWHNAVALVVLGLVALLIGFRRRRRAR